MKTMDLSNRQYGMTYEEAVEQFSPLFQKSIGKALGKAFESLRPCPKIIEAIGLTLAERDVHSNLDPGIIVSIHQTVEQALPETIDDIEGFHQRPDNPIKDLAFVGTRYAHRTTRQMIEALRTEGFDDLAILDLAIAVADANQWARLHRLLGLPPELFYFTEK